MDIVCKLCGHHGYYIKKSEQHETAYCSYCHSYIKHLPQNKPITIMPFGKYKGREISSLNSAEELRYIAWMLQNSTANEKIKQALRAQYDAC